MENINLNKVYLLGLTLSRSIKQLLEELKGQTKDYSKKLELQLIGHHGIIHPYFKSMISLIRGLKEDITKKGVINANVEQDFIKMFILFGQIDLLKNTITRSINKNAKLSSDEKHKLENLKKDLDEIKVSISFRSRAKEPLAIRELRKILSLLANARRNVN